jgi:hypothetical protein
MGSNWHGGQNKMYVPSVNHGPFILFELLRITADRRLFSGTL